MIRDGIKERLCGGDIGDGVRNDWGELVGERVGEEGDVRIKVVFLNEEGGCLDSVDSCLQNFGLGSCGEENVDDLGLIIWFLREDPPFTVEPLLSVVCIADRTKVCTCKEVGM